VKVQVPLDLRERLIQNLRMAGLKEIEIGSFVSEKWVPQMAGTQELCQRFHGNQKGLMALVPNRKGFDSFLESGLEKLAFFTAASEEFNLKNTNKSIEDSLRGYQTLACEARDKDLFIRMYVSTVFHCPYSGRVALKDLDSVFCFLDQLPFDELSLGDTIGKATPREVREVTKLALSHFEGSRITYHFHDTYGMALSNVSTAMDAGISSFDSSVSGLGGCPYAPGASGNLATEDLVYLCEAQGMSTGIDLQSLCLVSDEIDRFLNRNSPSRVQAVFKNQAIS
jgi:hydroxymethylglutaryl-CoA lyase